MAIKANENFITLSNSVTFRKPRGKDLVTASELIPGFYRSKSNVPTPGSLRTIKSSTHGQSQASNPRPLPALPPHGIYIDTCINWDHFNVIVTCTSTLMLPWQPSFGSHVFQNCICFSKIGLNSIFTYGIIIIIIINNNLLLTTKLTKVKPVLGGHPLLSGQQPKSPNFFPLFFLNETFMKRTPLLSGCGHLKST